jgi:hypothetical protein
VLLQSSDDEPSEEKDCFVAQLYKFMDDRGNYYVSKQRLGDLLFFFTTKLKTLAPTRNIYL